MIKGVIEEIKGKKILKRSVGSMLRNSLNIVGNIEILNAALSKNDGSGIQTD
jgi:hypothetical protein